MAKADAVCPGQISGYHAMVGAEIRVCAHARLGTESRSDTPVELHDHDDDPALKPDERRTKSIDAKIKARRDVRSTIARYGFIESYSIMGIAP